MLRVQSDASGLDQDMAVEIIGLAEPYGGLLGIK